MTKAIERHQAGLTIGRFELRFRGGFIGSVRQQVHDGDTNPVRTAGHLGVRFLGVDAPELRFTLPGASRFTGLGNQKREAFQGMVHSAPDGA